MAAVKYLSFILACMPVPAYAVSSVLLLDPAFEMYIWVKMPALLMSIILLVTTILLGKKPDFQRMKTLGFAAWLLVLSQLLVSWFLVAFLLPVLTEMPRWLTYAALGYFCLGYAWHAAVSMAKAARKSAPDAADSAILRVKWGVGMVYAVFGAVFLVRLYA